ncbi:MAG: hypothetical protein JHC87_04175, partial [Thermoleophilaceae bacterium]|nr:hypothetical protein [Thermoleophilaceae bacterium]
ARDRVQLSMLRLSDEKETVSHLQLSGHARPVAVLERYLKLRGMSEGKCMLTFGITAGSNAQAKAARSQALRTIRKFGGVNVGTALGKRWVPTRFRAPYIRHGMWEAGYCVDTFETSADWSVVPQLKAGIDTAVAAVASEFGEQVHVFTHLSHIYRQGSSVYTTYVFRAADSYAETLERWRKFKAAACEQIVEHGATISHHHGVGYDHSPYLEAEKGPLGIAALESVLHSFDPAGMMNPGKLMPDKRSARVQ